MKGHYDTLKIGPGSSQKQIKEAFHKLSKEYHPDNQETGSHIKFVNLKNAYDSLRNRDKGTGTNSTSSSPSNDPWDNSRDFDRNNSAYYEYQRRKAYERQYANIYNYRRHGESKRRNHWDDTADSRHRSYENRYARNPRFGFMVHLTIVLSTVAYCVIAISASKAWRQQSLGSLDEPNWRQRYELKLHEEARRKFEENRLKDLVVDEILKKK